MTIAYTPRESQAVTIPSGSSVSNSISAVDTALVGFITPAAWDAAALSIEVSPDDTNWYSPKDSQGSSVGYLAAPLTGTAYSTDAAALLPWRYLRFRSGTSAAPVNQTANRVLTAIKRVLA